MAFQSFQSNLIITHKARGFWFRGPAITANTLVVLNAIQQLRRFSQLTPTELDITYGVDEDISADTRLEFFLGVVDPDNLPEVESMRFDCAWTAAQKWQVSAGGFTIPTQTLSRSDPRFFRPKSWANLEPQPRRLTLCVMGYGTSVEIMTSGVIRFTEILLQRTFGNDNAFTDVHGSSFHDDHGMEFDL